jgi:hypothetical protein
MEILLVTAYTVLFIFIIRKIQFFRIDGLPEYFPSLVFILKVISGILLGFVYTQYYTDRSTADTLKFFRDSNILFETLKEKPYDFFRMLTGIDGDAPELRHYYINMDAWLNNDVLFNDNKTIIRLNTLFHFFSLGYYNVHVVFLNIFSFTGLMCLYKVFLRIIPQKKTALAILLFLLPSVLFWGSGLLKDGLLIFAFGVLVYSLNNIVTNGFSSGKIIVFIFSLLLLTFTKLYVLLIIFPGIIAWLLCRNKTGITVAAIFLILYAIYFALAFNLTYIFPEVNVAEIIYWKQKNFYGLAAATNAGSVIDIPRLEISSLSILKNSIPAFFTTLIHPFPTDVNGNKLILISAIENLFILGLIAFAIWRSALNGKKLTALIMFCISYVILFYILIGLITPVLGAMVRYKVPVYPVLTFLLLYLYRNNEKLKMNNE